MENTFWFHSYLKHCPNGTFGNMVNTYITIYYNSYHGYKLSLEVSMNSDSCTYSYWHLTNTIQTR